MSKLDAPFTPLFDEAVQKFGSTTCALVYGEVWRHCSMRDGYCHAAVATMAQELGLGVRTVQIHMSKLRELKVIVEFVPSGYRKPTGYICTWFPEGAALGAPDAPIPR